MNFLLLLFVFCVFYQLFYQLIFVSAIIREKKSHLLQPNILPTVSILICAKNESENLKKNLPFILQQNYPDFEVIVVDDGSDERLTMYDERLTIINVTKEEKIGLGKKYALQKGIEAAKNKLVLLTDADCTPVSKNWISEMASCINDKHKIVLGISPYKRESSFLNSLIEYETAQTAMQYIGFALVGNPYMCVGRNVLYDAALLKSKKWTSEELSIASGDDDLMIQSLATKENTTVCLSKDSYTISEPKKTWKDFIKQKLRHYESGHLYKSSHRFLLGTFLLTKAILYSFLICLLFYSSEINYVSGIFVSYLITIILFQLNLNYYLQLNRRWYFAVINDILYCIFTITLGIISLFKPTKNWK